MAEAIEQALDTNPAPAPAPRPSDNAGSVSNEPLDANAVVDAGDEGDDDDAGSEDVGGVGILGSVSASEKQSVANPDLEIKIDPQRRQQFDKLAADRNKVESQLAALRQQVQQYRKLDWAKLQADDDGNYLAHRRQYEAVRDAVQEHESWLQQADGSIGDYFRHEAEARNAATVQYAKKHIPGWTPKMDIDITNFAQEVLGYSVDELGNALSPRIYRTLYLAHLGHKASKAKIPQPSEAVAPVTPTKSVRGKSAASGAPSAKDSVNDWMRKRAAQKNARR